MTVFTMGSVALGGEESGTQEAWGTALPRLIVPGRLERGLVAPDGGTVRFGVRLTAGAVYTIEFKPIPAGVWTELSLCDPVGELVACDCAWGRTRLVHTATTGGRYAIAATIDAGADAFALRVVPWSTAEMTRAIDDPLFVL